MTAALRLLAQCPALLAAQPPQRRRCGVCRAAPEPAEPQGDAEDRSAELVFVLERRGDGWGEEIFPHLSLQRREPKPTRVVPVNSVQLLLQQAGLPADVAVDIVARATSWRATSGGRQLLDKRKQRTVMRHAPSVLAALRAAGGPALDVPQLQTLLQAWPSLLELDATDGWGRCFCALALRQLQHAARGAGEAAPRAGAAAAAWEEEQREAARTGLLEPERVALLDGVGFDWGLVDRDWEEQFDQLLAFAFVAGHCDVLAHAAPGPLLDWARRQLALHRLGSLPASAEARLRAVGFPLHGDQPEPQREPQGAPTPAPAPQEERELASSRGARAERSARRREPRAKDGNIAPAVS